MITHGIMNDGSWELRIIITDLKVEKRVRVKGDMHIGGLILKLVEELGMLVNICLFYYIINGQIKFCRIQSHTHTHTIQMNWVKGC